MEKTTQTTDVVAFHGEGPTWYASQDGLRITDMLAGDILMIDSDGSVDRLPTGSSVAASVRPHAGGEYVVDVERGTALADSAFGAPVPQTEMWVDPGVHMNEGDADFSDRLYAGSMPCDKIPGGAKLYHIGADGAVDVVLDSVTTSNDIDLTADGRLAYYNNTATGETNVFNVDESGSLVNRRLFHDDDGGRPDGLCVDSEGNVWCAMNRVGKVRLYSPEAEVLGEWELPMCGVTAVALGGEDLRDVFITASHETADEPGAGAVLHMRAEVAGQPLCAFAG